MLGMVGEIVVASTDTTSDIVEQIKTYEKEQGVTICDPFIIKKIGIKAESDCSIKLNDRLFTIKTGESLEIGYNVYDIKKIVAQTSGVKLIIRYLW